MIRKNIILVFFIFFSCSTTPMIEGFDPDAWKEDAGGCNETRSSQLDTLLKNKSTLFGQSESSIVKLLGNPDARELYKRTQKFLIYYIGPGPKCDPSPDDKMPERLSIRISALGVVNEVVYYPK